MLVVLERRAGEVLAPDPHGQEARFTEHQDPRTVWLHRHHHRIRLRHRGSLMAEHSPDLPAPAPDFIVARAAVAAQVAG